MRSVKYETHYRIGVLDGKDVYYNPQEGLAIERDHMYLVEMTFGERCAMGASLLEKWENQRRASRIVRSEEMRARSKAHKGFKAETDPDYSERPSCVTRNVRLGLEEW